MSALGGYPAMEMCPATKNTNVFIYDLDVIMRNNNKKKFL
jgi:hypothetical protein